MHQAETLVFLVVLMTALVVISRKLEIPYPVLLVLGGLVISFIPGLPALRLQPDFVFYICLPLLIFPAALFTSWRDFRRNLRPILLLAIGLVLLTMAAVAIAAHLIVPGLPWAAAFALGAIVSPPDAIAAEAVMRRVSVPTRIESIVEGESLVNDATALVALRFAVAAVATGTFSPGYAAVQFIWTCLGGVAIGLGVGYIVRWAQKHLDDPPVQIAVSLLTPFLAYLGAERLHVSGVLATVTVGIFIGWHAPLILRARYRLQAQAFWEMVVFLINGLVFLTIGLQLPEILRQLTGESLSHLIGIGAAISATVILVRIGWLLPAVWLRRFAFLRSHQGGAPPSWQELAVVAWSGMRGVISLAAAFALPFVLPNGSPFPGRGYILYLTFCVILATLVLQGLTLPLLIRKLRIADDGGNDEEERRARTEANRAALELIERLASDCEVPRDVAKRLEAEYRERLAELRQCASGPDASGEIVTPHYRRLQYEALKVERATIIRLRNEQVINDDALRRIQRDLDLAEARLTGH
jgi:Na+/H+ antiporter, bacterial form